MVRRRIRGHELLHHLDATAIGGRATAVDGRGIIAHRGIVIVIVMSRRHVEGVGETTRKKKLSAYRRSSRGSLAHCQDRARSMVSDVICSQLAFLAKCLMTM